MKTSRQEYWSGLPFPMPGYLHDLRIELMFLELPVLTSEFFTTSANWEALVFNRTFYFSTKSLLFTDGKYKLIK